MFTTGNVETLKLNEMTSKTFRGPPVHEIPDLVVLLELSVLRQTRFRKRVSKFENTVLELTHLHNFPWTMVLLLASESFKINIRLRFLDPSEVVEKECSCSDSRAFDQHETKL